MVDKVTLLREIQEISFAIQDISLYLDTHPTDKEALNYFYQYKADRKERLKDFATHFYPLTVDCIEEQNNIKLGDNTASLGVEHWTWVDGDIPWAGVCE